MSLREIEYQEDYRSGYNSIVDDFFRPSLASSQAYWRAVGYFSSSALESFGAPLGEFIKNGGHIRLVTSVELSHSDLEAIQNGAPKQDICAQRLERIIETDFADGLGGGTARLVRLLELGRLEIQIAVPKTGTGIYHEKIGVFFDGEDYVAFTGSSNESRNAFENNRECVDVYPSWSSAARAARKKAHFEELWERNDQGVDVYSFPDAARQQLIRVCGEWEAAYRQRKQDEKAKPNKWRHQDDALEEFLAAERGVLNMATGTGKTRTSLKILRSLYERDSIDTVIVSTDGNDLLDQWYAELLGVRKDIGAKVFRHYKSSREVEDFLLAPKNAILLVSRQPLASALRQLPALIGQRTLLIHDEVHGLGSPANRNRLNGLSDNVRYRLGLSATPEREYDDDGNAFLLEHVGPELMRFELDDAIRREILAPFDYFPLSYDLTAEDRQRVRDVYKRQAARAAAGNPMSDEEVWIEIARVYKTSRAKLPMFDTFIRENQHLLERCIVFVETQEYGDEVLEIIHKYRSDFHTYFSGEESETLKRFARGELECLITCHRVSEGIDIRSLNSVILFSSARARLETIQRMGRCLRTDPDNPEKTASIVDFIRHSDEDGEQNADEERAEWLTNLSKVRAGETPSDD
ncbi:DEAD/DEAH box helicase family protein [Eilatimonas milleporae]|uniref:Superfamily II DNA or RNA helicase n=1 Tax=Eilatimonas milleporae TaxID=911205 RepID=A0A3M0BWH9_9PROT|nr:DEAD/DEAH box helicase family protein [Eilatimonas milleporae]RMB01951.1 superfamily II DNA or RNA helicase [Eilatimonas milleporae]